MNSAFLVLTAPAGTEVEPSSVVLAARAVVVEHAARRRRGLQGKVEFKLRLFPESGKWNTERMLLL